MQGCGHPPHRPPSTRQFWSLPCVRILCLPLHCPLLPLHLPTPPPAQPFLPHRSHPSLLPPPHFPLLQLTPRPHSTVSTPRPESAVSTAVAIEEGATGAFADRSVEMGMDASVEMGADPSGKMGADASVEMGVDASGKMGADASGEMGADASVEMRADASIKMRVDASDAADNFSNADKVESPRRGRQDKTKLDAVAMCHTAMDALVKNCALATGLSQEKILCSYHHVPTPNRAEELVRAETAAVKANLSLVSVPTPAGEPPRVLTPEEIKLAWPLFQKTYSKEHMQLLDDWDALDRLSNKISIGMCHCQFTRTTRNIIGMLQKFAMKFGFHSLFIMTSSYLNVSNGP
ncbi:hypothetical protein B0H14DRAFT_3465403 [Mycena olivaceomarginata]|nr:hypothetical protein B0H14DRAFT_3465403 [Mycena olivaceomarginata]